MRKTREETRIDDIAMIVQTGFIEKATSHEIAKRIEAYLEAEAEYYANPPRPRRIPVSWNLADIDKLPTAAKAQVLADQERASAARERIMAQVGLYLVPPPRKSPPGAVAAAMQAILPQCAGLKQPKAKLPKVSESEIQREVIRWFSLNCYEWQIDEELLMAFPLQGKRTKASGGRLKAEGMRKGTLDVQLCVPRGDCCALWIEFKTATGRLSPEQKLMLKRLTNAGAATVVCRSAQEAQAAIRHYLNLPTPSKS